MAQDGEVQNNAVVQAAQVSSSQVVPEFAQQLLVEDTQTAALAPAVE